MMSLPRVLSDFANRPTSTAVSVQLGWQLLPVSVQENAEVGWNGYVQRLPAESEDFSMFFQNSLWL